MLWTCYANFLLNIFYSWHVLKQLDSLFNLSLFVSCSLVRHFAQKVGRQVDRSYKTKSEFSVKINTALSALTCLSPYGSWDRLEKWKKLNFCFLLFKSFPQICSRQLQHEIKAQFSTKALPKLYHTGTILFFQLGILCSCFLVFKRTAFMVILSDWNPLACIVLLTRFSQRTVQRQRGERKETSATSSLQQMTLTQQ